MSTEQVNLDLTVTDKASKPLADVADQVDDLERSDATVQVDAETRDATRGLADVQADADKLHRTTVDVQVDADVSGVTRKLRDVESTGRSSMGNVSGAVRDIGGPLGDVTLGAGDMGDAFVSAGEVIGGAMGLSTDAIGKIVPVLAGVGVAIGLAQLAWQALRGDSERATKAAEDYRKELDKVAGALEEAARAKLLESITDEQAAAFNRLGLSLDDVASIVRGNAVPAWSEAVDVATAYYDALKLVQTPGSEAIATGERKLRDLSAATGIATDDLDDFAATVERAGGALDGEAGALKKAADGYRDKTAFVQQGTAEVKKYGESIRGLPAEVATTIYPDLQDTAGVERELDNLTRDRTTRVWVDFRDARTGGRIPRPGVPDGASTRATSADSFAAPASVVVNVTTPRTPDTLAAGRAAAKALDRWRRVNGGR